MEGLQMAFDKNTKVEALVRSRRRCCVCHAFLGLYAEVHHIIHESKGGPNSIENAIVLCGRCHGEAGHYNPEHPKGNKYSPQELRKHRDSWWSWCERNGGISSPGDPVGVSPTDICLVDREWNIFGEFMLSNRTQEPYWQVWVRLALETPTQDVERLIVGISERSSQGTLHKRIGDLSLEPLQIITQDESGRRVMFVMIDRLRPGEYVRFTVRLPDETARDEVVRLFIDLWSIKNQPLRWGPKDGEFSMNIPFPVALTGEGSIRIRGSYPVYDDDGRERP